MRGLLTHPSSRARRVRLWLPAIAYMAFIFGLSSISAPPTLPAGADKQLHTLLYAGLGALVARAVAGGVRRMTVAQVVQATVIGAAYGISDELHQYFTPPRAVEALDAAADAIGSALGAGLVYAWGIIRGRDGV